MDSRVHASPITDADGFYALVNLSVALDAGGVKICGDVDLTRDDALELAEWLTNAAELVGRKEVTPYRVGAET
jgi:hypothetical protein